MSYRNSKLACDMDRDCSAPVARMDEKGFVYCEDHGLQRKSYRRCRRLSSREVKHLQSGQALRCYRKSESLPFPKPDPDHPDWRIER